MIVTNVHRGRVLYTITLDRVPLTIPAAEILDYAIAYVGETRSSLFDWTVEREGNRAAVILWTD